MEDKYAYGYYLVKHRDVVTYAKKSNIGWDILGFITNKKPHFILKNVSEQTKEDNRQLGMSETK